MKPILIKKMNFIICICKEHYSTKSDKIKAINRKFRPFWFQFKEIENRRIPLFIIIELCRLIKEYKVIKVKVITCKTLLIMATNYLNQIFDSRIEIIVTKPLRVSAPSPMLSHQAIKKIRRILMENFSSYMFFDLENIPGIKHQNTQNVFVKNIKTRDPKIYKKDYNVIKVPIERDSADIVSIIMMTYIASNRDKSATINVKSNDNVFKDAKRYISIDQKCNQNINIIDSKTP